MARFLNTPQTLSFIGSQLKKYHQFLSVRVLRAMHVSDRTRRRV